MARQTFGGDLASVTWSTVSGTDDTLRLARSATGITAWTALTGGTQVTDLQSLGGGTLASGIISADINGQFAFLGPDGVYELYLEAGVGSRVYVLARLKGLIDANDAARQADLANRPVFIVYGTGAVPLRTAYTSDITKMAVWVGTTAPPIATNGAGGAAVDGLDWQWKY